MNRQKLKVDMPLNCMNGHNFHCTLDSKNIYCNRCGLCRSVDIIDAILEEPTDHSDALDKVMNRDEWQPHLDNLKVTPTSEQPTNKKGD